MRLKCLKPCWCGASKNDNNGPQLFTGFNAFVECPVCGLSTRRCNGDDEAIAAWNTRPLETELVEALKEGLTWLIVATANRDNPLAAKSAVTHLRKYIEVLEKAGVDPGIRMVGLEEIDAEIDAALVKTGIQ